MLNIVRTDHDNVTVLELTGIVNLGEGATLLRKTIRELVLSGRKKFVLVYSGVQFVDSAGNGELVTAFTIIRNAGGHVVLACVPPDIQDLLQITKLLTVFEVFETVDQAISYFH
jgi:anti-sigma B factor antagonist